MRHMVVVLNRMLLAALMLAACGPISIGIQPPSGSDGGEPGGGQGPANFMNGVYLLVGVALFIALLALLKKP
jgi:hypothetical protein